MILRYFLRGKTHTWLELSTSMSTSPCSLKFQISFDLIQNVKGQFAQAAWNQICHIAQHLFLISHWCFPGKHRAASISNSMLIQIHQHLPIFYLTNYTPSSLFNTLMSLRTTTRDCQHNLHWRCFIFSFLSPSFLFFLPLLSLSRLGLYCSALV